MKEMLAQVDQFEFNALKMVDAFISRTGLNVLSERIVRLHDGYGQVQIDTLNLAAAGITVVIRATGYNFDFSLVKLPVTDGVGYSIQKRGVAEFEGFYFLGMALAAQGKSGILFGFGDDTVDLAAHIALRNEKEIEVAA